MVSTKEHLNSDESRAAAERVERAEMFSFHPNILREPAPLPRRVDGADYDPPHAGEEQP